MRNVVLKPRFFRSNKSKMTSLDNLDHLVIHFVPQTRSLRVVYLVQQLGLPYEVVEHLDGFPPQLLYKVHELGKVPIVEVYFKKGEPEVLVESGHIVSYLLRHFDVNNQFSGKTPVEKEQVDYWLHYGEASIMPWVLPHFLKRMMGTQDEQDTLSELYGIPNAIKHLDYVQNHLQKQKDRGSNYLVGDSMTGADLLVYMPVVIAFRTRIILTKDYPLLATWSKHIAETLEATDYLKVKVSKL